MGNYQRYSFLPSTLIKVRIFQKQKPLATLTITAVISALRVGREFVLPPEIHSDYAANDCILKPSFCVGAA